MTVRAAPGPVPRNFKLVPGAGEQLWLVVGNQETMTVASFAVDSGSGRSLSRARSTRLHTRHATSRSRTGGGVNITVHHNVQSNEYAPNHASLAVAAAGGGS